MAASTSMQSHQDDRPRSQYTTSAISAVTLKIVDTPNSVSPENDQFTFHPDLAHQLFGPNESIYGYLNLKINIYITWSSAKYFVDIQYSKALPVPDDIMKRLAPWLPAKYYINRTQFIRAIAKEDRSLQFGNKINSFDIHNARQDYGGMFSITQCSISEPGFLEFHSRFECMIVWFIDAASHIDMTDPNWTFFYIYEEKPGENGVICKYPVGYCTVYKFFHFPDKIRVRISQLYIIPPRQHKGLGTKLLRTIYEVFSKIPNVIDITVEDPCDKFVCMRDKLDCQLLTQLEPFKCPAIHNGFSNKMYLEANKHYKINKSQVRHVYELLRAAYIIHHNNSAQGQRFYAEIKQRLEGPLMREHTSRKRKAKGCSTSAGPVCQPSTTKKNSSNVDVYMEKLQVFAQRFLMSYPLPK